MKSRTIARMGYHKMWYDRTSRNAGNITSFMVISFVLLISFWNNGCGRRENNNIARSSDGYIWLSNPAIRLRFDNNMVYTVFNDQGISVNTSTPADASDFIECNDTGITEFTLNSDGINYYNITTAFGTGRRLVLKGEGGKNHGIRVEKTLTVEMYDNFPGVAITRASYKNTGSRTLTAGRIHSNRFILDATLSETATDPYSFWMFQGPAHEYGKDYIFPLKDSYSLDNYMGLKHHMMDENGNRIVGGGGVPVIDLWTPSYGFGLAVIEPVPKLVYLPVKVLGDKTVEIGVREDIQRRLEPGDSCQSLITAIIIHHLDFFDCLDTFSKLMNIQGVKMQTPSDGSYEPVWCSWGYLTDITRDLILQTLPKVKAMDIPWVVVDEDWFGFYGDWHVRKELWPGGDKDIISLVDTLHSMGFKATLWWVPTDAQGDVRVLKRKTKNQNPGSSEVVKKHPGWLIMDKDGNYPMSDRQNYYLCPGMPEVQQYIRELTVRFIKEWGFDGFKYDAVRTVPPCYNPAHHHRRPEESHEKLPLLYQIMYETTKSIKPNSVILNCNCGTTQDFFQAAWIDQPVTADPGTAWLVRSRTKMLKALMGPRAAVFSDHVEGFGGCQGFDSPFGTGAVIGTRFTWPGPTITFLGDTINYDQLTTEKEPPYKKWFSLYNKKMLSKGDYLNLYDIAYDKPETHVIRKGDTLFYAFFADSWMGEIMLRGLENKKYSVYDYVNDVDMGTVKGPEGIIAPVFNTSLLIQCSPVKK